MAVLRLIWAICPVTVDQAGTGLRQVAVPYLVGEFRQREPRHFASAGGIEQAKIDSMGVGGENGEVGAKPVPGGTERDRCAGQKSVGKGSHGSSLLGAT